MKTIPGKAVPAERKIEVDFLYLDLDTCSRCRESDASLSEAIELVGPVLDSVGADIEVRKTLIESEDRARAMGFVSSPTILVNGRDIAGELMESPCSECGELCGCDEVDCRVWDYRSEQHTGAPAGLIVEAVLAELAPTGAAPIGAAPFDDVPENLKRFFASAASEPENAARCCSPEEQATCCESSEKASCCGSSASSSCGCR